MKKLNITDKEFNQFSNELNSLLESFKNKEVYSDFTYKPITFLRKRNYDILYNSIIKSNTIGRSFTSNIFNHFKRYNLFNECEKCKLIVLFCIYFILGKLSLGAEGVVQAFEFIIDFIKKFYGENHLLADDIDNALGGALDRISPFQLSKIICRLMNKC